MKIAHAGSIENGLSSPVVSILVSLTNLLLGIYIRLVIRENQV